MSTDTDIAELAIKVDTKDIDVASKKIKELQALASGTTVVTKKIEAVAEGQARVFAKVVETPLQALIGKNTGLNKQIAKSAEESAKVFRQAFKDNLLPRDLAPNRFNTANIAAQFQDIAVTSAMGMSPMLIAMQQGTQVAAIINSMEKPILGLKQAFLSVINPVSLTAIAFTGLAAVLVQSVNWTSVFRSSILAIGNAVEHVLPYITALGVGLAIFYSPALLAGLKTLVIGFVSLSKAMVTIAKSSGFLAALLSPLGLVAAGVSVLLTLMYAFRDSIKEITGLDLFGWLDTLGKKLGSAIRGMAPSLETTSEEIGKVVEKTDEWAKIVDSTRDNINRLHMELGLTGKDTYTVTKVTEEYDLLSDALKKNINLNEKFGEVTKKQWLLEQAETIALLAQEQEKQNAIIEKQTEAYENLKGVFQGFFSEMRSDLAKGKSMWESFGNAVSNVLDKLLDKLMDLGTDVLFDAFDLKGSMGGFLTSVFGGFSSATETPTTTHAKGGVFTNSVVSRPTAFTYAKGGAFGVMGEAGPEAIMPLRKAPDGSLGVRSDGGGGVVVNIINNSSAKASVQQRKSNNGIELDVLVDETVSQKMSEQGTATNRALSTFNSRQLIRRG